MQSWLKASAIVAFVGLGSFVALRLVVPIESERAIAVDEGEAASEGRVATEIETTISPKAELEVSIGGESNEEAGVSELVAVVALDLTHFEPLEGAEEHSHTLGSWLGSFSSHPKEWPSEESVFGLALSMPDGSNLNIEIDRSERYAPGKGLYAGRALGSEYSEVIVSYVGDAVAGVVRLPEEGVSWELRNKGSGIVEWEKVDLNQLGDCAVCLRKKR